MVFSTMLLDHVDREHRSLSIPFGQCLNDFSIWLVRHCLNPGNKIDMYTLRSSLKCGELNSVFPPLPMHPIKTNMTGSMKSEAE